MKRYWLTALAMMAGFLGIFVAVGAFGQSVLTDPSPHLAMPSAPAAGVGVGLLLVDVLLPVPSSIIMVAHGALFGVVGGTALSLVGSVGATAIAFAIGRRGGPLLTRLVGPEERAKADGLFRRYGALAVLISRPLPLLAETVALLAGTTTMTWPTVLRAATLGALPPALLYAITGATAVSLDDTVLVFGLVLAVAGITWVVGRRIEDQPC